MDKKWWTLLAVCTGTFMLLLDVTIVIVAQPAIQSGLHASFSDVQWVLDAYALTLASLLLTSGVLADRYGRKRLFTIGLVIFTLGSLLCGAGPGPADADSVAKRPGRRRRDHVRHVAGPARAQLPREGPRRGVRGVGGDHRRVHGARPGARRRDHHELELARHLPGQRADRRPGRGADGLAGGGVEVAAPDAARLDRVRTAHHRPGEPGLRADPGGREQLVGHRGHPVPGGRCRRAGRVHRGRTARRASDVRPVPAAHADLRRRLHRRVRDERLAVRRAALAGPLPAGHPGLLGAGRRDCGWPSSAAPSSSPRRSPGGSASTCPPAGSSARA